MGWSQGICLCLHMEHCDFSFQEIYNFVIHIQNQKIKSSKHVSKYQYQCCNFIICDTFMLNNQFLELSEPIIFSHQFYKKICTYNYLAFYSGNDAQAFISFSNKVRAAKFAGFLWGFLPDYICDVKGKITPKPLSPSKF